MYWTPAVWQTVPLRPTSLLGWTLWGQWQQTTAYISRVWATTTWSETSYERTFGKSVATKGSCRRRHTSGEVSGGRSGQLLSLQAVGQIGCHLEIGAATAEAAHSVVGVATTHSTHTEEIENKNIDIVVCFDPRKCVPDQLSICRSSLIINCLCFQLRLGTQSYVNSVFFIFWATFRVSFFSHSEICQFRFYIYFLYFFFF